jgi:hypothetical protein
MAPTASSERLFTTPEFGRWWEAQGHALAFQNLLDTPAAKLLAWEAWRKGREHLSEAAAARRLQLARP